MTPDPITARVEESDNPKDPAVAIAQQICETDDDW